MKALTIKKELHKAIDVIENEQLLKAIYMIVNEQIAQTKNALKPFTLKEFYERNEKSENEIKLGKVISHKDVKKKYNLK
ncbi:MAG: hypothetical protein V4667_08080 [Bacteroidota bacterium]